MGKRKKTVNRQSTSKNMILQRAMSDDFIQENGLAIPKSSVVIPQDQHHISTFLKEKAHQRKVINLFAMAKKPQLKIPDEEKRDEGRLPAINIEDVEKEEVSAELKPETKQGLAYIFKMGKEKKEKERREREQQNGEKLSEVK